MFPDVHILIMTVVFSQVLSCFMQFLIFPHSCTQYKSICIPPPPPSVPPALRRSAVAAVVGDDLDPLERVACLFDQSNEPFLAVNQTSWIRRSPRPESTTFIFPVLTGFPEPVQNLASWQRKSTEAPGSSQ